MDDGFGCGLVGSMYKEGQGVKQDYVKANGYFEKSCAMSEGEGCYRLGYSYYVGLGVSRDYSLAKLYFEKACSLGVGDGCFSLGSMYSNGFDSDIFNLQVTIVLQHGLAFGIKQQFSNI